jgi:hypothetical protein
MKATRGQLARIHIARKQLGLDEPTYRAALRESSGKASAGDMTYQEASLVIRHFEARGFQPQSAERRAQSGEAQSAERKAQSGKGLNAMRYADLAGRPGMASPQELRKIEAMWADVAYGDPAATLRKFLMRTQRVTDLRFLTARAAWEVIEAIKAIGARYKAQDTRKAVRHKELHDGGR